MFQTWPECYGASAKAFILKGLYIWWNIDLLRIHNFQSEFWSQSSLSFLFGHFYVTGIQMLTLNSSNREITCIFSVSPITDNLQRPTECKVLSARRTVHRFLLFSVFLWAVCCRVAPPASILILPSWLIWIREWWESVLCNKWDQEEEGKKSERILLLTCWNNLRQCLI